MSVATQSSNNLYCDVCKLKLATQAEYALHEFSKKHCDNLLRIAKNKPIISKQKSTKSEQQKPVSKEVPKVNVVTTQGNFAKYGYFIPGEVYETYTESRQFNTEYDPYLQKYAENPVKETAVVRPVEVPLQQPPLTSVASFKKKKKRKIKDCEICNVVLQTVPEYDAHMKSPEHSWKLKVSGMGVSAHFVKANSDLHTIVECNKDVSGDETLSHQEVAGQDDANIEEKSESGQVFPTLYCDICELLLNSEQQFNAHVNGKTHNENVQKKADLKAKKCQMETPVLNQLYCFSCRVSLNNLYQYNEHKLGKKHKMKCRRLMKEGITIPPEERIASWGLPKINSNERVVYPEMYEKFLLENQRKDSASDVKNDGAAVEHGGSDVSGERVDKRTDVDSRGRESDSLETVVVKADDVLTCNICHVTVSDQAQFNTHVSGEDHAVKIVELKESGTPDDEILKTLLRDRSVVKPDETGRHTCTICSVTTGNETEFRLHIASLVHEQSKEEFRRRRRVEVKHAVRPADGKYTCKSCSEACETLTQYNEHLHASKHGETTETGKRKLAVTQQKRARKRDLWMRRKSGANKPDNGTAAEEAAAKRKLDGDDGAESKKPRGATVPSPKIKPLMTVTPSIPPGLAQRRPPSLMDTWTPYPPAMANPFRGPNLGPQPLFPGNRYRGSPSCHPTWPRYPPYYP